MTRIAAYGALLRDEYPSTDEEQAVHLAIDRPDPAQLSRWLPLVKWLLATPHYFLLGFVAISASFATMISWFVILFTGRQPRGLFDLQVALMAWGKRVAGYATLLVTDQYPPFGLHMGAGVSLVLALIGLVLALFWGVVFIALGLALTDLLLHRL